MFPIEAVPPVRPHRRRARPCRHRDAGTRIPDQAGALAGRLIRRAGPTDILARIMGQYLSEHLGQQFVDREPARRRQQYRHRSRGECAARRLHAAPGQPGQRASTPRSTSKLQFNFIRDIAPVASITRVTNVMEVNPNVPGQDGPGIHRLCQGQSGQDQHGLVRQRHLGASIGRTVQGDDRHQHDPRALSRRGAGAHRYARPAGAA